MRPQLGMNVSGTICASLEALMFSPRPVKRFCKLAVVGIGVPSGCVSAWAAPASESAREQAKRAGAKRMGRG